VSRVDMILERISYRAHGGVTLFRFLERSKLGESRKGDDFSAAITESRNQAAQIERNRAWSTM